MNNGECVCNFSVATNETWKQKDTGEKKEAVEFHRIVMFRKLAEIAGQYLKKGSQVYLEGKLKTRKFTNKDGIEQYVTEVECHEMQMLGAKGPQSEDKPKQEKPQERNAQGASRQKDFEEDDIPFAPIGRGIAGHAI